MIMNIEREKRALAEYQALLEAWENVEIVTKKDGTPFKTLKRNFKGCIFFKRYNLEYIGVSIAKDRKYYHDDLLIWKDNGVEELTCQIKNRIKQLETSVKSEEEAIKVIENKTIDIDELAESIMNDIKEKCNDNMTAISHYKFELMNKLKESY